MLLQTPNGSTLKQALKLGFKESTNTPEYEILLVGFRVAEELHVKELTRLCRLSPYHEALPKQGQRYSSRSLENMKTCKYQEERTAMSPHTLG